jgi:hypothetical protein
MSNRIRLWQSTLQKVWSKALDLAIWTWNIVEKAIVGWSTALGIYNASDISHKIADLCNIDDLCRANPYTAIVLGTISSAILANLVWRWVVAGSKAWYNYLTNKRNVISRPWVTTNTTRNNATSSLSTDTLTERDIIDTRIRNLEDARDTIDHIITKIQDIKSDLETIEHTIDAHINAHTDQDKLEVLQYYGWTDQSADIQEDLSLQPHDQYFTTQTLSEQLKNAKHKVDISNSYLPRIQYTHNGTSFDSTGKYLIGSTDIESWLSTLESLQNTFKNELHTLSNQARSANTSSIALELLNTKLNSWSIATISNQLIQHIESLGISKNQYKEWPIEETLIEETHWLKKSFKNSQDQSKTLLQKLGKKIWL